MPAVLVFVIVLEFEQKLPPGAEIATPAITVGAYAVALKLRGVAFTGHLKPDKIWSVTVFGPPLVYLLLGTLKVVSEPVEFAPKPQ
jgi:hypothetical protein